MSPAPEQLARAATDAARDEVGWVIQDRPSMNLPAARGVAVREFKMAPGHGFADHLLFVDGKAVGVLEAQPAGLNPPVDPLPFLYLSTGVATRFTDPHILAQEIADDLRAVLAQIEDILGDVEQRVTSAQAVSE